MVKMQKDKKELIKDIQLLVMDVDGTLTDGKINISPTGEIFKSFHVRDGYGLKHLLPNVGIKTAIITGRESEIVAFRAKELDIKYIYQNIPNKVEKIMELCDLLDIKPEQVAYIGDDLNDLSAMSVCGVTACPSDAVSQVKSTCDYICTACGGAGAVREFIDWICVKKGNPKTA